jgi:hypothetical protein
LLCYTQIACSCISVPLPLLPQLLAEDWLGDRPASLLKMVIQGMNVIRPSFYPHALGELASSLQRLAAKAAAGLQQLAGMDPQSSSVLTTGVGRYGKFMLVSCAS